MQSRRKFISKSSIAAATLILSPLSLLSNDKKDFTKITILHTNDTQSQLEPFAIGTPKYEGWAGVQARADLIQKIRADNEHVLLLDAGDFFHGSPLFDTFGGAAEIEAMNAMDYDAACIGEHEFDGGIENLAQQLSLARFPFLCANYELEKSALFNKIKSHTIIEKGGIRIGIFGIGIALKGLCTEGIVQQIGVKDPIKTANETAQFLKQKKQCDFVICLSHLGLNESYFSTITDKDLATDTASIDLIIGGHSHSLLQKPLKFWNKEKKEVLVAQVGWGGTHLGQIDYLFSIKKNILSTNAQTVEILK